MTPYYAKEGEWEQTTWQTIAVRFFFGAILIKVGLELGNWDSKDEELERAQVIEYEADEQIFDYLHNKQKRAVFLFMYSPGHHKTEKFNYEFEVASGKYVNNKDPTDDIVFMRVPCAKNLNFCTNKMWEGRVTPACEVYYLNEQDKIELADFDNRFRSREGIESFFVNQGLIEDKMNPNSLLERAGK